MAKIVLEGFERSVLFRIARFVAMFAIFVLLSGIAFGTFKAVTEFQASNSSVTPSDVVSQLKSEQDAARRSNGSDGASPVPSESTPYTKAKVIKIPFTLQRIVNNPEAIETIRSWVVNFSDSEQKIFLDDLAKTAEAAETANIDPIDAINKYRVLKFEKLEEAKKAEADRNTYLLWFAGAAATSLILIALLSLTLVLLAVERNTRKEVA